LNLKYDILVSKFAFKCNLYCYTVVIKVTDTNFEPAAGVTVVVTLEALPETVVGLFSC
jgi:hypothetical protein